MSLYAQDRASDLLKGERPPEKTEEATSESPPTEAVDVAEAEPASDEPKEPLARSGRIKAVTVEITEVIDSPNLFILRRAIKTAIENQAEVLILDINTPGGRVDIMLEMTKALERFAGTTIAYVNDEAISAGAYISFAADEIWYAPGGVIGAAAVVAGSGEEIPETMRQKIDAYILAKMRAVEGDHPHKAKVMQAMMDADYVLRLDGKTIKAKGELLALTAKEAMTEYGNPPTPLFGEGIAQDVETLLDMRYGAGNWERTNLEITWSEELAKYLKSIGPLLVAFGILAVFIELKTPGFGLFGIAGIGLLGIVFATNYMVGLAGWEPFLVLLLGLLLIALDIFFLPGTFVLGGIGIVLVFGSLVWSLADVWPTVDGGFTVDPEALMAAMAKTSLSIILTAVGAVVLIKILPKTGMMSRLVVETVSMGTAGSSGLMTGSESGVARVEIGARGVVTRPLRPTGEVKIEGRLYEARIDIGTLGTGDVVEVVGRGQFNLEVRKAEAG